MEITGKDNQSYADVSGSYYVIGPYLGSGFLLETDHGVRSACQSSGCNWYLEHSVLLQKAKETVTTIPIEGERLPSEELRRVANQFQPFGRVYLLGTALANNVPAIPPTVSVTGSALSFHYAVPDQLVGLGKKTLREVSLTLQVRHAPDVQTPSLSMREDLNVAAPMSQSLQKWLK